MRFLSFTFLFLSYLFLAEFPFLSLPFLPNERTGKVAGPFDPRETRLEPKMKMVQKWSRLVRSKDSSSLSVSWLKCLTRSLQVMGSNLVNVILKMRRGDPGCRLDLSQRSIQKRSHPSMWMKLNNRIVLDPLSVYRGPTRLTILQ